ncbi:lethal(3)malignant brain tumor-like protein 4 [Acomys russatus]|uniref:lethal(3)malignant brain tumor-like protein 4 n=1 Tax=Acomys russatus TaxID=60746 RepID=UPI0021E28D3E|nr:lethal(3)malignant brain tumor-like protein 4 [Acomys russatus]
MTSLRNPEGSKAESHIYTDSATVKQLGMRYAWQLLSQGTAPSRQQCLSPTQARAEERNTGVYGERNTGVYGERNIGVYEEQNTEQVVAVPVQEVPRQPISTASTSAHPFRDLPLGREQHYKLLPGVADIQAGQVAQWTADEVAGFVQSLLGCEEHAKSFQKEQIDGKAFLLLTQTDIVKVMRIKLGPALKIYNSILMFRSSQDVTEDDVASGREARR